MDERKAKILIIDDDLSNRRSLEMYLGKDFSLEAALDGREGQAKLRSFQPDLILLDIMMPVMDGIELCRLIRKDPAHRFRKIIMLSGKGMLDERLEGYEAGADDYLVKPFKKKELLAKIQVFLRLKYMEEVNELKDQLLMLFSHETRTPLTSIIGYTTLLKQDPTLEVGSRVNFYARILQSARYLGDFAQKVVSLCRLKSNPGLQICSFEPGDILASLIREGDLAEKQLPPIHLSASAGLVWRGDPGLFREAVTCLLEFTARRCPPGGEINLGLAADDAGILLSIEFPGVLEPDEASLLFEEFQVSNLSHHHQGQNLALPIVKRIAELHGGKVDFEESGGLLRLRLQLP